MCYSIAFLEKRAEKLNERYKHAAPQMWKSGEAPPLPQYYFVSVFEKPALPVLSANGWSMQQWGLVPFWVKDATKAADIQKHTGNAKCETIFEKPSFRHAIKAQRCIIPVSGFFEWQTVGKQKLPYFIYPKSDAFFSLGGVYDYWKNPETGQTLSSFSIITTPANALLSGIHNAAKRMPLILHPAQEQSWLKNDLNTMEIEHLMLPFADEAMQAYRVSTAINNVRNRRNVPQSIERIADDLNF